MLTKPALGPHHLISHEAPNGVLESCGPIFLNEEVTHPGEEVCAHNSSRDQLPVSSVDRNEGSNVSQARADEVKELRQGL